MVVSQQKIQRLSRAEKIDLLRMLDEKERRECERSFFAFFCRSWEVLEPTTPLKTNWHMRYLCDIAQREIERISRREPKTRDLIINVPPRSAKTRIFTEALNAWAWTRFPHISFISWSYASDLSIDKTVTCRRLIESPWYQNHWGHVFAMRPDQNAKSHFDNDKGGSRRATSTGGGVTGQGGDVLIGDDPQNPREADSETARKGCIDHYSKTMYNRLNDPEVGLRIIVQQRLHEEDLTGHLKAVDPEKYEFICIPAEESDDIQPPELRAFYRGGLFFPSRFSRKVLADLKSPSALGAYGYAGQYQQRPSPAVGGMFKKYLWRFWIPAGERIPPVQFQNEKGDLVTCIQRELPRAFENSCQAWDLPFDDDGEDNSAVSGQAWKKAASDIFLLDEEYGCMDYVAQKEAFRALSARHPDIHAKLVEKKANGSAIRADLRREIPGIIPVQAETDKVTRARPLSSYQAAGNVYLPHPYLYPWVNDLINEFALFPKGKLKDRVDAAAHAANFLFQASKEAEDIWITDL